MPGREQLDRSAYLIAIRSSAEPVESRTDAAASRGEPLRRLDQLDLDAGGKEGRDNERTSMSFSRWSRTGGNAVHLKAMPVILTTPG
jgi:hypothetical protein